MNQNKAVLNLLHFTNDDHPFGNKQGKDVFRKLSDFVDKNPSIKIFEISLEGIEATDASFPRESVIALAKLHRGEKGFYLDSLEDRDLIDNWDYAAKAKEQPITIWNEEEYEILGPEISYSNKQIITFIFKNVSSTTAKVADAVGISIPNASTKLKKLVSLGFIMRSEMTAESGGIEFIYHRIK